MNKKVLAVGALSLFALAGCNKDVASTQASKEIKLETLEQKVSYSIGVNVANGVRIKDFGFDTDVFAAAVSDVKNGADIRLTEEEMSATMQEFQTTMREKAMAEAKQLGEENLTIGKAHLEENAKVEGVVQTESGLQYKIITKGEGQIPQATDSVVAHYSGKLLDGTEFDSSYTRGQPATFGVTNLIPGWVEALQIMPVGSKWELTIPAELAYGERGNQGIPPNSTLKFELELIEIVGDKKEEAPVKEAEAEVKAK